MYYGVAYYPEHWPEERWQVDAELMQAAGVNRVRMGEFAWSKIEPEEGEYDFDWMDRAIALLGRHGVKTMMCTMSRTPPPWVFHKYPEIANVREDGHVANYGHRYTVCHNTPRFIELSQRIDRAVVEHFAGNPDITAWHIDNEIGSGNTCYCDVCRGKFHDYLREKYGTVENLNEKWGVHFWSSTFSAFEEVPLPVGVRMANPSLTLEYARFQSATNADFARWRYDLIKQAHPSAWVTTNFQHTRALHTDIFDLGMAADVYGTNLYPPNAPEFALDYCRGSRGELLILEQRSGQPHWQSATAPGWMRLWSYRSIGHGACGINYFRWRPCRWGQEEYWHAVLPHSGRKNRRYDELAKMGTELAQAGDLIASTRPAAETAVVMSYESRWALNAVLRNDAMRVDTEAYAYHDALMAHNVTTDGLDPHEDLAKYRLVIAPRLYCVDDAVAQNLRRYVADGGVLCLTPRSCVVDEYNVILNAPAPGPLADVAGVEVDDYGALDAPLPLKREAGTLPAGVQVAETWADEIIVTTAQVLATYDAGWLKAVPAITVNEYGEGKVVYVGTVLRGESLEAFVAWLCDAAGVALGPQTPDGVRAHERQSDDMRLLFLLNYGESERTVALDGQWDDVFTGEPCQDVAVEPAGVRLLKRAKG